MTRKTLTAAVLIVVTNIPPVFAGLSTPQERLMAKRAAELDAYRMLAERIMGLRLSSTTTVRDFVTESDEISTGVRAFLRGASTTEVRFLDDGTVEVDMAVTLRSVVTCLKELHSTHYHGGAIKRIDYEEVRKFNRDEVIRVTGNGASRSRAGENVGNPSVPGRPITAPGGNVWDSIPPQQRLMAKRAALVDGYRKLAEQVYGLHIDSRTTVRDFVTEGDVIRTEVEAFLRGAREVETRHTADGIVEVDVAMTLNEIITTLQRISREHRGMLGTKRYDIESIRSHVQRTVIVATGMGAPTAVRPTETSTAVLDDGQDVDEQIILGRESR